jgi:hypothetical protein
LSAVDAALDWNCTIIEGHDFLPQRVEERVALVQYRRLGEERHEAPTTIHRVHLQGYAVGFIMGCPYEANHLGGEGLLGPAALGRRSKDQQFFHRDARPDVEGELILVGRHKQRCF